MDTFDSFQPGRLSAAQAYSHVKGYRMAIVTLRAVEEKHTEDEDDLNISYVALQARFLLRRADRNAWLAAAQKAGYVNAPSDEAQAVALATLDMLSGMDPEPEPAEAVA
jgi:predicted RNase H-like nuclease